MISPSQPEHLPEQGQANWEQLPVAVIFQTRESTVDKSGSFLIIDGWTRLLSGRRMIFECRHELHDKRLCVYMEHPESDHTFFEIRVRDMWPSSDGCWRYDTEFTRLLSDSEISPDVSSPDGELVL